MTRASTIRRLATVLLVGVWPAVASCGGSDPGGETADATDTLTRRQKDSLLSTMPAPGAGAVGRAMRASDLARERARAHDSIR